VSHCIVQCNVLVGVGVGSMRSSRRVVLEQWDTASVMCAGSYLDGLNGNRQLDVLIVLGQLVLARLVSANQGGEGPGSIPCQEA
jgi:hypothetical protein